MQGSHSGRRSAVRSGLLTGLSTAAVSGSAALAGAILSRKFGHGVETDGFFAAYFVYVAVVLVASALRVVVLPEFARAQEAGKLGREVGSWALALAAAARAARGRRDRGAALGCRAADQQLAGAGERRLAAAVAHPGRGAAGLRRDLGERPRRARRLRDRRARLRRRRGRRARRDRRDGRPRRAGVRLGPGAERSARRRHPARAPCAPARRRAAGRCRRSPFATARRRRRAAVRDPGALHRLVPLRERARLGQADDALLRLPHLLAARGGHGDLGGARLVGAADARRADARALRAAHRLGVVALARRGRGRGRGARARRRAGGQARARLELRRHDRRRSSGASSPTSRSG